MHQFNFLYKFAKIYLWIHCSKQQLRFVQNINKGFDNTELLVEHNIGLVNPYAKLNKDIVWTISASQLTLKFKEATDKIEAVQAL